MYICNTNRLRFPTIALHSGETSGCNSLNLEGLRIFLFKYKYVSQAVVKFYDTLQRSQRSASTKITTLGIILVHIENNNV